MSSAEIQTRLEHFGYEFGDVADIVETGETAYFARNAGDYRFCFSYSFNHHGNRSFIEGELRIYDRRKAKTTYREPRFDLAVSAICHSSDLACLPEFEAKLIRALEVFS